LETARRLSETRRQQQQQAAHTGGDGYHVMGGSGGGMQRQSTPRHSASAGARHANFDSFECRRKGGIHTLSKAQIAFNDRSATNLLEFKVKGVPNDAICVQRVGSNYFSIVPLLPDVHHHHFSVTSSQFRDTKPIDGYDCYLNNKDLDGNRKLAVLIGAAIFTGCGAQVGAIALPGHFDKLTINPSVVEMAPTDGDHSFGKSS
jgi:hypothetical protein